jgi:hypothetical protein
MPPRIDTATARRLAVAADVDPRTVIRVANGEAVRGMAAERAARVLRDAGLLRTPEMSTPAKTSG